MLGKSKIKYIQSLGQKKFRDEAGLFIAEGPKIVSELLKTCPAQVKQVFAVKEWLTEHEFLTRGVQTETILEQELEKISQLKTPNKVLALVEYAASNELQLKGQLSIGLCGIQDPGNLGTIIRIADWFGVTQVICSEDSADLYNPKVIQSTMGSIARVNVFYTDLANLLSELKDFPVFATVLDGEDVKTVGRQSQGIILIGNESKGIPPEILSIANKRLTISRKGGAESLNAGVATGIILSHLT
ncbi:MAG TPA: RNA methyltransferase [Chitinophagaceae bacterium]|nr:RNA methyltransferase [Chitinophagaceae bacterium]